jgi:glycosyltransferase involved in cell wall biosynthesis
VRILFLSRWFPWPPANGSKLRIYNLLRGVAQHHEVTLLSFVDEPGARPYTPELNSLCQDVCVVFRNSFKPDGIMARFRRLGVTPRSVAATFSPEMARNIQELLSARDYDLVVASQLGTACYSRYFRGTPALFDEVEVAVLYERFARATSFRRKIRDGLTWTKHRRYLAGLLGGFRACTVVSAQEQQLLSHAVPDYASIEVIPNFIDLADYSGVRETPQENTLIFTGSFRYSANYHAMTWFLERVYPLIQVQVPDVRLIITGDHANLPIPVMKNVTLTGFVEEVRPLIASSWVSLAPIWIGGGTRLKILEAMALATPVVSTSKGGEGLDARHGRHLLIADTPQEFAENVIRLLREPELRRGIADRAYQLVRDNYDRAAVMPRFLSLVRKAASV